MYGSILDDREAKVARVDAYRSDFTSFLGGEGYTPDGIDEPAYDDLRVAMAGWEEPTPEPVGTRVEVMLVDSYAETPVLSFSRVGFDPELQHAVAFVMVWRGAWGEPVLYGLQWRTTRWGVTSAQDHGVVE